jgi:NAD(P)-dependent dehydrogenase (short-subunit alcohol dehydrogenase family)
VARTNPKQVVVITGASAGVGRATARRFAKEGARIALLARGTDGLEAAAREVQNLGGRALAIPCDVADAGAVEAAAERAEQMLGPIDVWINNAMVSVFAPVQETTPEEYQRVTEVTYLGFVYGTLAALKRMRRRDRGRIIFVGSALAYRGIPLQSAYCAAKHAVQGFFDSLRAELLHDKSNIHVCMVQLPALNTPQFRWSRAKMPNEPQPVPPIFQPEVAARAIHWAAHHRRREIYVGLPVLRAIVGNKLAPAYADSVLADMGYDAQMTDEPRSADRPDNLYSPVPGDHGARGVFDDRARPVSYHSLLSLYRAEVAVAAALVAGIVAPLLAGRGRRGAAPPSRAPQRPRARARR